jgi:predicted MFS family arabinose efflux permease
MNFLRNTLGVLLGLAAAGFVISFCLKANSSWINYKEFVPFEHWESILKNAEGKSAFFWMLLGSSGLGVTIGGVITAVVVKYAKVAYAILIGFIMLFIAMLDIIIFPYHPTFYKILIFITYFPFAWVGGKIVEVIYERKKRKLHNNK